MFGSIQQLESLLLRPPREDAEATLSQRSPEKVSQSNKQERRSDLLDRDGGSDGSRKAAAEEKMGGIHTGGMKRE